MRGYLMGWATVALSIRTRAARWAKLFFKRPAGGLLGPLFHLLSVIIQVVQIN